MLCATTRIIVSVADEDQVCGNNEPSSVPTLADLPRTLTIDASQKKTPLSNLGRRSHP
jgi:hypothetical protein